VNFIGNTAGYFRRPGRDDQAGNFVGEIL